ncbi:formylglycine-generating enzyme family protein [Leptolyngbya iicbica]|uniref:Sulfatase-modifying factor protein n=2 Tax=Cyanophyceae TaxID=3028117 RepID=A0A4Q7E1Y8_9CYAN|nr:SUMF1/EgtB/PvdO family nonheme iron enzyme [Leptolyngbya sp. LK]RZM75359.1 sulfatase-modifying factor protein [Leptolyngbya sp. LK]
MTEAQCTAQPGFIFVAGGPFQAGSDAAERDYGYQISAEAIGDTPAAIAAAQQRLEARQWFAGEQPSTQIDQPAFCIAANLVTQADYQAFVDATNHRAPDISAADYQAQGFLVHPYTAVQPYLWQANQPPSDRRHHPVVLVSYADALTYAEWRGQQDGVTYRLPTELEWQKAARGTDGRYFPWGNPWQAEATNWGGSGLDGTSEIATFPLSRSPYGVEDMAGNVFEFTSTLTNDGTRAVMKGCSWDDLPGFCRAAYRHTRPVESRHILFGFRLVME